MSQRSFIDRAVEASASLLAMLTRAAADGELAPGNAELAARLGYASSGTIVAAMHRLEASGAIRVTRYQRARVVEIVGLGIRTRTPSCTDPHWRDRAGTVKSGHPGHPGRTAPGPLSDFAAMPGRAAQLSAVTPEVRAGDDPGRFLPKLAPAGSKGPAGSSSRGTR